MSAVEQTAAVFPTGEEFSAAELQLHQAVEEGKFPEIVSRIHRYLNADDREPVTLADVGEFVYWLDMYDMHLRAAVSKLGPLRESIVAVAYVARDGCPAEEAARYDEYGKAHAWWAASKARRGSEVAS